MKSWFKNFWFVIKSYVFAFCIQILFLSIWDWYVDAYNPGAQFYMGWNHHLPRWITYLLGTIVFCIAHFLQVLWHHRKAKRNAQQASS